MKVTKSLNLIAYMIAEGCEVDVRHEGYRVYGVYEENEHNEQVKEQYRNDLSLHRFLNEFKNLKVSKVE